MNRSAQFIFRLFILASLGLSLAVIAGNAVDAYRMRDPEYVRIIEDRRYFEEVIEPSGLQMRPAMFYAPIESRSKDGQEGGPDE